jgi:hypothetical protein
MNSDSLDLGDTRAHFYGCRVGGSLASAAAGVEGPYARGEGAVRGSTSVANSLRSLWAYSRHKQMGETLASSDSVSSVIWFVTWFLTMLLRRAVMVCKPWPLMKFFCLASEEFGNKTSHYTEWDLRRLEELLNLKDGGPGLLIEPSNWSFFTSVLS